MGFLVLSKDLIHPTFFPSWELIISVCSQHLVSENAKATVSKATVFALTEDLDYSREWLDGKAA